ncbi:hypothetical protein [Halorubrum sp. CGM5_25_10-8B]|uniref:hypothetical protein n=1 Tax=Halorubrum sp. CGM5_25_10-8B TaxID=2518115 RepID=UPI0010F6A126|nr:hypothetical protein [Halorubrum sp. CGM5_25_10-8B]
MSKDNENGRENSRLRVVGQKRDMLLERVYDTTKFADLDKKYANEDTRRQNLSFSAVYVRKIDSLSTKLSATILTRTTEQ